MRSWTTLGSVATALPLFACSGDGEGGSGASQGGISAATAQGFQGIYTVTSLTENPSGCDVEGESLLDSQTEHQALITSSVVLSDRVVWFASCSDDAACRANADAIARSDGFSSAYNYWLSAEASATELTGFMASTGMLEDGMCTNREYSDLTLVRLADGGIRFESRTKVLADQPPEDGFCVVEPAQSKAEAAGVACSSLRVIEAAKSGEL